jgi:glycosyltransferase involved in cell wall biosynthesis
MALMDVIPDDWRFVFVGSQTDSFKAFVKDFLAEYPHLAPRLEFHQHITSKHQLYEFYSRAKIFCLPSRIESFGNVLMEAQHFGAVIASNETIPSVQDLVDGGRAGITFSIENENEMAERLLSLMKDQERMKEMSKAAYDYARKNLVWKDIVAPLDEKIKEHYRNEVVESHESTE